MPLTETIIVTDETGEETERTERKRYTLAELKAVAEEDTDLEIGYLRALEKLAEWATEHDWWQDTLDSETDHIAEKYGITYDPKQVTFDLYRWEFSFGAASVDERALLRRAGIDLRRKDARTIIEHGLTMGTRHYGGWIGLAGYEGIPDWVANYETVEAIEDVLRDAQNEMITTLTAEQEYLTGEEHLLEWAEVNDWRFYEDGRIA